MVFKVSDLLALATELNKDNMQYVSFSEYSDGDSSGFSVSATSSRNAPDSIDYEDIESVPDIKF